MNYNIKQMFVADENGTEREIVYYEEEFIKTLTRSLSLNSNTSVKMIQMPTISRQNNVKSRTELNMLKISNSHEKDTEANPEEYILEIETIKGHGKYYNDTLKKKHCPSNFSDKPQLRKLERSKSICSKIGSPALKRSSTVTVRKSCESKGLNSVLEDLKKYLLEVDPQSQRRGTGPLKKSKSSPSVELNNTNISIVRNTKPWSSTPLEDAQNIQKLKEKPVYPNQNTEVIIGKVSSLVSVFEKIGDHPIIGQPRSQVMLTEKNISESESSESTWALKDAFMNDSNFSVTLASSFAATIKDDISAKFVNDEATAKFTPIPIDDSRRPSYIGNTFFDSADDGSLDGAEDNLISSDFPFNIDMTEEMSEITEMLNKISRNDKNNQVNHYWAVENGEQKKKKELPPKVTNIFSQNDMKRQSKPSIDKKEDSRNFGREPENNYQELNKKGKALLPKAKLLKKISGFFKRTFE